MTSQWTVSVFYGVDMVIDSILACTLVLYLLRNRTGTKRKANIVIDGMFKESDHNSVYGVQE